MIFGTSQNDVYFLQKYSSMRLTHTNFSSINCQLNHRDWNNNEDYSLGVVGDFRFIHFLVLLQLYSRTSSVRLIVKQESML